MDETTWNRVKRIFHEAMARPPADRGAFLLEACSGDTSLRAEVDELLAAHDDLPESDTASHGPGRLEGPGTVIGRYKLLQRIGEGGFGVVYMAEQQEPVRRRVALKIIKPGMDTRQVVARFESERQALAMMEHPGIAKVLEAGATEAGRPYFVMELVKGVPITEFCDANRLSTSARLELFVEVCRAVHHAHQKGIIHRDLKPSNVMVTLHDGKPVPKVIDFGVAKATQQRLTEKTVFTAYGQFIGTPAYMSPEQAEMSALDVDTRSDVYSLGVLLYELLVGTTPFDPATLRSAAYGEIQRILKEVEPPRPSTRLSTLGDALVEIANHRQVEPGRLARLIRGDLDWIVMKSLDKDRERRYGSASELAADVLRHIGDEPVVARPPSTLYRLAKVVSRQRGSVAAAGTVMATIVLLGSVALWQGRLAQHHATRIRTQSLQVRAGSILATAAASEDPLLQALLLGELGDTPELAGRLQVAREVANAPVPTVILRGPAGEVRDVAFSPDGRTIVTAAGTEARIWSADGSGRALVLEHDAEVIGAELSADGARLLTRAADRVVRVWLLAEDGAPLELAGALGSFAPDGARVVVAGGGTATVWPVDGSGAPLELTSEAEVSFAAFSSDGNLVLTGHDDGTTRLWPADGRGRPVVLRGHDGRVAAVWLDVDDTEGFPVETFGDDGTVRLWRRDGTGPPQIFRRAESVGGDRELPKWYERGSNRSVIFTGPRAGLAIGSYRGGPLAVSDDGALIADGFREAVARIWGPGVSGETLLLRAGRTQVLAAAFDRDGARLVTGHADGTARVWRVPGDEPRIFGCREDSRGCREIVRGRPVGSTIPALAADLDPDGLRLATGWSDGTVRIGAVDGAGRAEMLSGHAAEVASLAFSPDGTRVLSASEDGTARIWSIDGRAEPIVLRHAGAVLDAAFSPDGDRVATASRAGNVARIFSADGEGTPIVLRRPESDAPITSVAFSPDGSRLVSGGPGTAAWIWRSDGLGEPVRLPATGAVRDVAFSPDGSRVALACDGGEVRLWSSDGSGEPVLIHEHLDDVNAVAFSPDGSRLASASADGTIRVRWLDGSQDAVVLSGHKFPVRSVGFDRDGNRVISAGEDGTARLWRIGWPGLESYFKTSVHACLTPDERRRFLAESRSEASQAFSECERRYGR